MWPKQDFLPGRVIVYRLVGELTEEALGLATSGISSLVQPLNDYPDLVPFYGERAASSNASFDFTQSCGAELTCQAASMSCLQSHQSQWAELVFLADILESVSDELHFVLENF